MITGCFTALISPFRNDAVDYEGLEKIVDFQIQNGINGILAVGTTGESPALSWQEHNTIVEHIANQCRNQCICIAGTGSNNTKECLEATKHAQKAGANAVLLVDPYYNGPSSLEIRREYIAPVASAFPDIDIIPYIIPGRTGTKLLPEDLAILHEEYENVQTVKEATGDTANMKRIRELCGPDFSILSGDDALTFDMMTNSVIRCSGIISVVSNIAPKAVAEMVELIRMNQLAEAREISDALMPLFNLVTFTTTEKTPFGNVVCRARNPLGIKVLVSLLGMPAGRCRRPLGKVTQNAMAIILETVRSVNRTHPEILKPAADYFNIDIEERLYHQSNLEALCYETY